MTQLSLYVFDQKNSTYKQLYDSVKSLRVRSKEQCDDLINKVNLKSAEVSDLNASLQEKVLVDVAPLVPKLRKNMTAHNDYIRHTQEEAAILREIMERVNLVSSASGSMSPNNTKHNRIQQTQTKAKKNTIEDHLRTVKSSLNKASVVDSKATSSVINSMTNVNSDLKCASCNGCFLSDNHDACVVAYKNSLNKAKKNKIEDHLRTNKSSLNKESVIDSKSTSSVINSVTNLNSNVKCTSCNGCLLSDNHDACVVAYKNSVNASKKSKSVKTPVKRKVWKSTRKLFKSIGHIWKPTGRIFTLVGNVFPLTRIDTPTIVPPREPIPIVNSTDKPVVTLVYSRKPKSKKVSNKMEPNNSWGSSSSNVPTFFLQVVQIVLWYLDSDCSKHMTEDRFCTEVSWYG
uniref:Integrase, catalytic region, zinc finger, CCHC-type, peptidase aspartic, catalytic n=1 Tax=Tanacetum cinerariifolium TaxID=118510 RepID=A0A699KS53_TANCI|nr:hypothetical protein [Tanacetum cinerariifolium]